ncbi:MAG: indolepyruvate oxidoreductase subunit beta family protein, partial [Burkholderiaceae bacterium]|nr:indolepyruvate oxidoreductase subunit beta family protein [Burkholderiaceae bacterium]
MSTRPIKTVLIAALGGEGGGVLANWLVACARNSGRAVQATSVPGVAQKTGATSYYLEWTETPIGSDQTAPTFALSPVPARVDVVIASEGLEAARMMERGFVTPEKTCLIASTSRVYTTAEKMHMEDGRFDDDLINTLTKTLAKKSILMDMEALRQEHKTAVSAVMFGALCGADVLGWSIEACEAVIKASGKGVQASLAGFHAARLLAASNENRPSTAVDTAARTVKLAEIIQLGEARCLDYQDASYAAQYRAYLTQAIPTDLTDVATIDAWTVGARHLALWMCYEDLIRVADLKTKPDRLTRVRNEAQATPEQLVYVTEHFKPGLEEVASVLPHTLGQRLLSWASKNQRSQWHVGLHIRSTSLWGYLMLRSLARMRGFRRSSLRFKQESQAMTAWWAAMQALTPKSPDMG